MKKNPLLIALTYIVVFRLLACSQDNLSVSPGPDSMPIETATNKSSSYAPAPTRMTPTHTPSPYCVTIVEQLNPNPSVQGKIVLSGVLQFSGADRAAPSYLLDLRTGENILLPQEEFRLIVNGTFSVSPNREWLAYTQANSNSNEQLDETLHIVTADGIEAKVIRTGINQRGTAWSDNSHLLMEDLGMDWTSSPEKATAVLWLLSPFTGERRQLIHDFPDKFIADNLLWDFSLSRVVYSPNLSRIIYPTVVEYRPTIRLIDSQTNETLAEISTTDFGKFPQWTPDGKRLAFATQTKLQADWASYQDEIFTLAEDGKLVQLTQLSEANDYSYITGLAWSADSRYIAFLVNTTDWIKGYKGVRIATLDTLTGETREYCDIGNPEGLVYTPSWGNPIWSPDGKYLLVNLEDPSNEKRVLVVIIEVSTGNTYQIAENFRSVGWLK